LAVIPEKLEGWEVLNQIADKLGQELNTIVSVQEFSDATANAVCILCGSPLEMTVPGLGDTRFGVPGSYDIYRCVHCGLEETLPRPSPAELKKLYETYYNFGGETGTRYTRLRELFFLSFLNRFWSFLDGDVSFYQQPGAGRLLDIGCNEGRGLRIYARNGFEVEGLELNTNAAAVARSSGFEVHTCLLNEFQPAAAYDVAVLSNVLEHSLDPQQMLVDVHRILGDNGQVWISCPNSESWLRRVFGGSWINWHVPFHISHFSASTLRELLESTGYTQIEIRDITPALWVAQSLIAFFFARKGKKNRQLRNPFLILLLMLLARFALFPVLWLENKRGRGDCLLAFARKA
jgi:2-polyprenyl-3-methyl-5-hydroxy-6-metoxy-1,4-benzoquinol methylase